MQNLAVFEKNFYSPQLKNRKDFESHASTELHDLVLMITIHCILNKMKRRNKISVWKMFRSRSQCFIRNEDTSRVFYICDKTRTASLFNGFKNEPFPAKFNDVKSLKIDLVWAVISSKKIRFSQEMSTFTMADAWNIMCFNLNTKAITKLDSKIDVITGEY